MSLRAIWPFSVTFSRTLRYHHLPLIRIEPFCMAVSLCPQDTTVGHNVGIKHRGSQYLCGIVTVDRGLQNLHSWVRIPPAPPISRFRMCELDRCFFSCTRCVPRVWEVCAAITGSRPHARVRSASSCSCRERTQGA